MPVVVDPAALLNYAAFPPELDRDWLGRVCHLGAAELEQSRRRTEDRTRLGYALQLVTLRAIGTFLSNPVAIPAPVVVAVARQLDVPDLAVLQGYSELAVRWRHSPEIRDRQGYRDFTAQPGHFLFTVWLYRQAWADDVSPSVLFRAAHRHLLAEQILLPGHSVLARLVAAVRDRAARRLHTRLTAAAPPELVARLEKLLLVPQGARRSELDRLRRTPFTPTITGLVKALQRLAEVRGLGAGALDLSGLPARRVAALARYADQAWATQLADLGGTRRVATLVAYTHLLTSSAGSANANSGPRSPNEPPTTPPPTTCTRCSSPPPAPSTDWRKCSGESVQRITTENTTLKQRVRQLTQDNRVLEERLSAARSNVRFQDRKIAQLEAQILDIPAGRP